MFKIHPNQFLSMKKIILFGMLLTFLSFSLKSQNYQSYGVTLCGAEFGENNLPGVYGVNYVYPQTSEIDYFASKGVQVIQLPFKWERIQRTLGGPLDTKELSLILKFVDECAQRNIKVTLVLQNFGRYKINGVDHVLGDGVVTAAHFKDFWRKMAVAMLDKYNVYAYSLMAEPHDMGKCSWATSAQQGIQGIREVDRQTTILVDGDNFSNPETWMKYNDNLKYLYDPANKMMFNAHCYFDDDHSGSYRRSYDACSANENTGVNRMKNFVDWLRDNNKKGFVGEFGVPKNDQRWLKVMDNFLNYLKMNNIGGCYWAAGQWWKNYPLSIEPINNNDQPQMKVYAKYLPAVGTSNTASVAKNSINSTMAILR